ncbi:DUF6807 family protein, partial [Armatimonas sp.]|uniref:DUF6807 family protein n=1 Tax=Armatimonas sp. TaxID=1872638 RepID=UPI00286CE6C9
MTFLPLLALPLFQASQPPIPYAHDFDKKYIEVSLVGKNHLIGRFMMGYDMSDPKKREETYKPYLHILDPDTGKPITKGAGGEFTHHRGIFIGWNKLTVNGKTYDRWHMTGGEQVVKEANGITIADSAGSGVLITAP